MRLASLLGASALVALGASGAGAANFNGWYLSLEGGANWVNDNDGAIISPTGPTTTLVQAQLDSGWAVLGSVGYAFDGGLRAELEFGYRDNDSDGVLLLSTPVTLPGDNLSQTTIMANVLYDIQLSDRFNISIGGGVGADLVSFGDGVAIDDDDWSFAYQGIVGLNYTISRRADIALTYRYLQADGGDFGSTLIIPATFSTDDFKNQTVTIGLRYDLSPDEVPVVVAPPPPPPPPPPAPQQFLVFFGFDKFNLTEEAQRVVSEAAHAAKTIGAASIVVVGHTDTMGSPAYNQDLSERRAGSVRDALAALGIPANTIMASGRGETELLIQTGDKVKEPQNRRTTIDLEEPSS